MNEKAADTQFGTAGRDLIARAIREHAKKAGTGSVEDLTQ